MPKFHKVITGLSLSTALIAGGLLAGPSASAAEVASDTSRVAIEVTTGQLQQSTSAELDEVIAEARAGGYVTSESTTPEGTKTSIDLGKGFTFDLVSSGPHPRIGAGSDGKGVYVSFNATDQNMIISGAAFALGAAVCAVSGGTFCVVVGAILTAATVAVTGSGAIRCGTKSLRVYPFAGGKVKPRCA